MSVLHTVMAATLALSGTLPGLPSHRKRPANRIPDGSWIMGARERSRLAWRQRVDAAARAYHLARMAWRARVRDGKFGTFKWQAFKELADALSAPRPWRSQRKPEPRRRYSRSHRRACQRCRVAGYGWRRGQVSGCSCEITADYGWGARVVCVDLRDPHGRRER